MTNAATSDLYFVQEPVGEMANLAYLVGSHATREALLVDPAWDVASLLARAERDGMRVVGALATHYHQDHVGGSIFGMSIEGLPRLMELQPMPVHVQAREAEGVRRVTGLSASDFALHEGGDEIALGFGCCTRRGTRPARSVSWSKRRSSRRDSSPATRCS